MFFSPQNFVDLAGQRFGRLTVLSRALDAPRWKVRWHCRCDCGAAAIVWGSSLRSGGTQSCGCLQRERVSRSNATHRLTGSPEYVSWQRMLQRCHDPNSNRWRRYGGRGIRVCQRWLGADGFVNFRQDMGLKPHPRLTLERIDNDGNYEPANCCWATYRRQARNQSTTTMVRYLGKQQVLADLCDQFGIMVATVKYRIRKRGMSVHDALATPVPMPHAGQFQPGHPRNQHA